MGMNFYVEYNRCSCCERHDTLHIGKSSFGWTFSFQGYDPERNTMEVPDGICIKSEADWREFLNQDNILIKDEDGEVWSVESFWEKVDSKRAEKNNHTIECRNCSEVVCGMSFESRMWTRKHGWEECWLDDKGNSFSGSEFS